MTAQTPTQRSAAHRQREKAKVARMEAFVRKVSHRSKHMLAYPDTLTDRNDDIEEARDIVTSLGL